MPVGLPSDSAPRGLPLLLVYNPTDPALPSDDFLGGFLESMGFLRHRIERHADPDSLMIRPDHEVSGDGKPSMVLLVDWCPSGCKELEAYANRNEFGYLPLSALFR